MKLLAPVLQDEHLGAVVDRRNLGAEAVGRRTKAAIATALLGAFQAIVFRRQHAFFRDRS
jgi:hypothetical protein